MLLSRAETDGLEWTIVMAALTGAALLIAVIWHGPWILGSYMMLGVAGFGVISIMMWHVTRPAETWSFALFSLVIAVVSLCVAAVFAG